MKDLLTKELHGLSVIRMNDKEDRFNSSNSFFSKSDEDHNGFPKEVMTIETSPTKPVQRKCTNVNPKYNTTHKKTLGSRLSTNNFAFRLNFNNTAHHNAKPNNNANVNANKLLTNESDFLIRKLQRKYTNKLQKVQEGFAVELDKLYKDNFDKIEEINTRYNVDIYKHNNIEDDKNKSRQILNDKENELNEVENEFIIKKNCSLMNYNEQINTLREEILKELNHEAQLLRSESKLTTTNCNIHVNNTNTNNIVRLSHNPNNGKHKKATKKTAK